MGSNDPDGRSEINRRYYEAHKEDLRRKHREYWKTYRRRSRALTPVVGDTKPPEGRRTRRGHAVWSWIETAWAEQKGKCYICGDSILLTSEPGQPRTAQVDHDHRCCPGNRSCRGCRRGLACPQCNKVLGQVNDDLDRLELIARNARAAWNYTPTPGEA